MIGELAHLVERLVRNQKATSSILVYSTNIYVNTKEYVMDIEKIIDSSNTKDLVLVASQYCTFIEKIHLFEQPDAMDYLLKIIPLMYIKGLLIPTFDIEDENIASRFITEEEYGIVYVNIKDKLDQFNYFESFTAFNNQVETYDLSEMIADIYQDMKDFILLYQKNTFTFQANALWNCRHNFYESWGTTITLILPYLHQLLYPVKDSFSEVTE